MSRPRTTARRAVPDTDDDLRAVEQFFRRRPNLAHIRVRHRGALITLESGPSNDPIPHARLRRVAGQIWQLEMATHTGRWQPTPLRAPRDALLEALVADFGWVLTPQA
ncbi:hypothetical protein OV079_38635 [Nannocystis pusilla]|uniref:Uncharacterized protein n=1 Tax=Nannocystis pusilla TaxID=889268 RepID=A0A9X3ELH4_9BACT|nr:hypothetical protein [Nannocystis pusilla]MCY1006197.1 hypothetical protein [Nannocystis pusilla]MCY1006896.1 hypothetical protein [Nannocystis pusilla]MCY1007184.1 hypothetical protein [Nannocystis pusilla]MCY1010561.1 hypothetical protein [Nannocystis pusilla]MCY1011380.1 hypothetical protein [Nannocystis pusilla]